MNTQNPIFRDREAMFNLHYDEECGCMNEYDHTDHVEQFDELAPLLTRLVEITDGHLNECPERGLKTYYSLNDPPVTITIDLTESEQNLIDEAMKAAQLLKREMLAKQAEAHALQNQKDQRKQDEAEYERLRSKLGK